MGRILTFCIAVMLLCLFVTFGNAGKAVGVAAGEAAFKQHCAICHPDGGNIVNPQKTLHKKSLEANNIKTAEDIVKIMRTPGPGMPPVDANKISDKEAREIADYILTTFK